MKIKSILILIIITIPLFAQKNESYAKPDFNFSLYEKVSSDYKLLSNIVEKYDPDIRKGKHEGEEYVLPFNLVAKYFDIGKSGFLKIYSDNIKYGEIDSLLFFIGDRSYAFCTGKYFKRKPDQKDTNCVMILDIDSTFIQKHHIYNNVIKEYIDNNLKQKLLQNIDDYVKKGRNENQVFEFDPDKKVYLTDNGFFNKYYVKIYRIENIPVEDFCYAVFYNSKSPGYGNTAFLVNRYKIITAGYFHDFQGFTIDKKWYLCFNFSDGSDAGTRRVLYVFENGQLKLLEQDFVL